MQSLTLHDHDRYEDDDLNAHLRELIIDVENYARSDQEGWFYPDED
jgi:hypothetical protein